MEYTRNDDFDDDDNDDKKTSKGQNMTAMMNTMVYLLTGKVKGWKRNVWG